MKRTEFRFAPEDHQTWKALFTRQAEKRDHQIWGLFSEGLRYLGIGPERIPDLEQVNAKLATKTGFRGVPVQGFEDANSFYAMLARREFPIGAFIRDPKDLSYTPEPDVFHDLYGHLPFFIDSRYADFCQSLGERATRYAGFADIHREYERLFWYTIEFALLNTPEGKRIFGAGIASSYGECAYALSDEPEVVRFDLETIRNQEFKIDEFQKRIFILDDPEQLYSCLDAFERPHLSRTGAMDGLGKVDKVAQAYRV